ncbi:AN1-type zinc finger protein 2A isoform X2 [Cervus elaphus]|uniref:AN1-type zinc finger protein 2A isoform X2 n=1 Tax=Cervus elaphus TaxID=9860 RepID=UPI001CC2E096|nr:AN1-type zinc finger protein 2A isoform X2 [Cervus elaphus]
MEFPDLGKHCSEKTCKQLDFLPLKCDACKQDFCKDHFTYAAHKCPLAFTKDVRVPVCPLCNSPVPVKKGEIPDVVVGAHMDGECQRPPGQETAKVLGFRAIGGFPRGARQLAGPALRIQSKAMTGPILPRLACSRTVPALGG